MKAVPVTLALTLLVSAAGDVAAQATADSTAAQQVTQRRPGLASWTTDRRDFRVGDVVTILVDELTIASADMSNFDEQDRSTNGSVGGSFTPPTGAGQRGDGTFRTRLDTESLRRGQARRRNVLTTEISARVTAVENGVLRLEGTRTSRIDKAEQRLTLTGWVRPNDISPANLVESWRLADAELLYVAKGNLGKPSKGIITRILGMLWP